MHPVRVTRGQRERERGEGCNTYKFIINGRERERRGWYDKSETVHYNIIQYNTILYYRVQYDTR